MAKEVNLFNKYATSHICGEGIDNLMSLIDMRRTENYCIIPDDAMLEGC